MNQRQTRNSAESAALQKGHSLSTPEGRTTASRVVMGFWTLGALIEIAYLVAFGGPLWSAAVVTTICFTMTVVNARVKWTAASPRWLVLQLWPAFITIIFAAVTLDEPATMMWLFPVSMLISIQFWRQPLLLVGQLAVIYAGFVGVSLQIGGAAEGGRVAASALMMLFSALAVGFLGDRFSAMTLEHSRFNSTIESLLLALQARDGYTADHSEETLELVLRVAEHMDISQTDRDMLADVALLHDIGKIGIPTEILHKPGPLDDSEWVKMREHPEIGERIVSQVPGFEAVAYAIRHEHERWDGRGYPDGLAGTEIPLASRIVLACDAFHAMTSDRPYRQAMPIEKACDELMRHSGSQFDPDVVKGLLAAIHEPVAAAQPPERDEHAFPVSRALG